MPNYGYSIHLQSENKRFSDQFFVGFADNKGMDGPIAGTAQTASSVPCRRDGAAQRP